MGNCLHCLTTKLNFRPNISPQFNILLLGMNGAGKTEILHILCSKKRIDFTPTMGCKNHIFPYDGSIIGITELGGSKDIRDIWKHYYQEAHGAIFVIDSSDHDRLLLARNLLSNIFLQSKLSGKPILVLGNKQDLPGAIDYLDFCSYLDIDHMANLSRTPCFVSTIGQNDCDELHSGMRWLLLTVSSRLRSIRNQNNYFLFTDKGTEVGSNAEDYNGKRPRTSRKNRQNEIPIVGRPKTAPHALTLSTIKKVAPAAEVPSNVVIAITSDFIHHQKFKENGNIQTENIKAGFENIEIHTLAS